VDGCIATRAVTWQLLPELMTFGTCGNADWKNDGKVNSGLVR